MGGQIISKDLSIFTIDVNSLRSQDLASFRISGIFTGEPSFTRLFDHEMWEQYTGRSPIDHYLKPVLQWRFSTVLASVWRVCLAFAAWAYLVASFCPAILRMSTIPMTVMGSAMSLLLVFRTNNTYARLNEARVFWGRAVFFCREVAQTTATSLFFDASLVGADKEKAREAAAKVCRYLAAWAWELNTKLTGPDSIRAAMLYNDDVIKVLLPENEARWIASVRSRPLQLLGAIRRTLQKATFFLNLTQNGFFRTLTVFSNIFEFNFSNF